MVDNTERVQRIITALERYGLKWKPGRTQARCNSPLRPGSNSLAFSIDIKDSVPGGGVFYDHVSKEGGNFAELEQLLPGFVAPAKSAPAAKVSTVTAYDGLHDYAQAQGVPERVLSAAGWRVGDYFCPASGRRRPALLFDTKTGTRARFIDGLKPKYMSPKGYQRCLYRYEEALHIAETTGQPLVIGNGEASTLVAQYFGVAATAITGGGENDIPTELLEELRASYQGPIIIALDSDDTGRASSAKMLATLRGAGYDARAVDLNGEKGFDLANFAKLHQLDTPAALLALKDLPEAQPEVSSLEVLRLRAEIDRLRQTVAEQQREIQQLKAEQRAQNDLIQNKNVNAADKLTILTVRRELAVREARVPSPEVPRAVNLTAIADRVGQSADTVSRCVKKFKGILWERHEVRARDEATGQPRTIIQLAPLPALHELQTIEPAAPRAHGGHHPKQTCAHCQSENLTAYTSIYCADCGQQHGEPQERRINPPEPEEAPTPATDVVPVPQLAALKHDTEEDLDTPPVRSFSPVPQVAAQAPTPATDVDSRHAPPVDSRGYRQTSPPPSWEEINLHQAAIAEAQGDHQRAAFLRSVAGRLS